MIQELSVQSEEEKTASTPGREPGQAALIRALPFLVAAVALLIYARTLGFGFVYDDQGQIVTDQLIRTWHSLPGFFTHHVWSFNAGPPTNYYRPLFMIWFLINHSLFGLNAFWWHLSTIAVHATVSGLVYVLWLRLTSDRWTSLAAGLIFAVHPVHVESVAWISGVTDPLAALFLLLSFLSFISSRKSEAVRSKAAYAASLLLFALAVLTKETAIVLVALIVVYEWTIVNEAGKSSLQRALRALKPSVPFFAVAILYIVARTLVLQGFSHRLSDFSASTVAQTWPGLIWLYIKLLVFPSSLSVFYDSQIVSVFSVRTVLLPAAGAIVVGAGLVWWLTRLEKPYREAAVIAVAFLILPMLPLLNLSIFSSDDVAHDRYLYIPSIGFVFLAAIAIRQLSRLATTRQIRLEAVACAVVVTVLSAATVYQSGFWKDSISLYQRGAEVASHNKMPKLNLGVALSESGDLAHGNQMFSDVLKLDPDNFMALTDAGYNAYRMGDLTTADNYLSRAIQIDVYNPAPLLCLGLTKMDLHQPLEAQKYLEQAIRLKPSGDGFHEALGIVLEQQGNLSGAANAYREELNYNPGRQSAQQRLAELQSRSQPNHKADAGSSTGQTPK